MRRALGGGGRPPPNAGAASAAVLPGGLVVAEVRQIFEQNHPTALERQFVVKGAPRDGAAVLAMQERHDRAGGSAPHLDIRSINGWNDGYGPMDRHVRPKASLGPFQRPKARITSVMAPAPKPVNTRNQGADNVIVATFSSSDDRPPPPPPGAAKVRRVEPDAPLFPPGTPYAEILAAHQKAPLAQDVAALVRERSPPRGDRRPLSKRNKSREDRAAAGGANDTYGQIRAKALGARSKTLPAEVFIGETPKRSRAVPPNQSALRRREARAVAVKRTASEPAEDQRVKTRGGPANPNRAAVRQADNPRLYQDRQGNVKSRRAKTTVAKTVAKKGKAYEPEIVTSSRPEDRYGVRRRPARNKSVGASRSREPIGVVA